MARIGNYPKAGGVKRTMGAIWKFKKVEYLNVEETAIAVRDYLLGDLKEKYKISIQKVGNDFRVQYIKTKNPVI
jgi:hypothetical protein